MSKLQTLRSQLNSLRAWRQLVRWGTGYAALLVALLWILAAVFVLDYRFQLESPERAVVIAIGAAALVWAAMKFTAPFLGRRETNIDMALLVERQQGIDSDLVAALQFESQDADQWGSRELEDAVVDYVAQLDRELNVFKGTSNERLWRRLGVLAGTAAVTVGLVLYAPGHARAFLLRLALGNIHYPSRTSIERVLVSGHESLSRSQHGTAPRDSSAVQGRSVVFAAWAGGEIPPAGEVKVYSSVGGTRQLPLAAIDRERIQDAASLLRAHLHPRESGAADRLADLSPNERGQTSELVAAVTGFDAAHVAQVMQSPADQEPMLESALRRITQIDDAWPERECRLFAAKLPRLLDPADYKITLGDAWTDRASISMIALPVVEPHIIEHPPEYAGGGETRQSDPSALQRSVLEGTQVAVAISSTKPLEKATLRVIAEGQAPDDDRTYQLARVDAATVKKIWPVAEDAQPPSEVWRLDVAATPLAEVRGPLRFELQVTDEDGVSLDAPLRGAVRLKPDRPPRISGSVAYRAVVPTAVPEIDLRASDDYGIAAIAARVEVIRGEFGQRQAAEAANEAVIVIDQSYERYGNRTPEEAKSRAPTPIHYPLRGGALPLARAIKLDLSSLALVRGDQLRIVFVATDYRGKLQGVTAESEPIAMEVSAGSGVVGAVAELDRRSQEQVDELIRRELGIGESP